jgi:hypothetical protein
MSLIAKDSGGGEFELAPEGTFIARAFKIVDLGTQTFEAKGAGDKKDSHKLLISWEILDDDAGRQDNGEPFVVSKRYTLSLHEKSSLRADLQAWRGKAFSSQELQGFDLKNVLGQYCQIQVIHDKNGDKTYANVTAIMNLKGANKPEGVLDDVWFDLDEPDMKVFESFSDRLKDTIRSAPEWKPANEGSTDAAPATVKGETGEEIDLDNEVIDLSEIPF